MNRWTSASVWMLGELVDLVRSRRLPASVAGRAVVAMLVAALLGAVGVLAIQRVTALPADAAFAVGDRVVTVDELDRRIEALHALYGIRTPRDDPARLDTFRRDAAKAVAIDIVLVDEMRGAGVDVPDATVRDTLDRFVAVQFGSRERFVRALGNVGTTEAAVLDAVRQQLAVAQLYDKITAGVAVSEIDARTAYPQYVDRLAVPERRTLRNIVVDTQEQAAGIAEQIRGGADFVTVARELSLDPRTRDTGGDLGQVTAAQLLPAYAAAAFGALPGGIFGPVLGEFGWNVGQVVDVVPAQAQPLEAVLPQLTGLMLDDRRVAAWEQWLRRAVAEAGIRYADAYLPADPLAQPAGTAPRPPAEPAPAVPAAPEGPR